MKFKIYEKPMTILPTSVQDVITEYSLMLKDYVSFCYIVFGIITSHVAPCGIYMCRLRKYKVCAVS